MCGSGKGNDPFGSWKGWQEWHQKWAADPLDLGLTDYSGLLISKVAGVSTPEEREEEAALRKRERAADLLKETLKGPAAPTEGALSIGMAAEVRDRRRRALLYGIEQLKTPGGGIASGGIGGANVPLG